jgi:hypothetical protein
MERHTNSAIGVFMECNEAVSSTTKKVRHLYVVEDVCEEVAVPQLMFYGPIASKFNGISKPECAAIDRIIDSCKPNCFFSP